MSKSFNTFSIVSSQLSLLMNSNCTLSLMVWMHTKAISLTLYLHSQIFRLEPFFPLPPTPFFAVISTENIQQRALKKSVLDVIKKPKQKVSFFLVFMRLSEENTSIITLQSRNCFSLSLTPVPFFFHLLCVAFSHFSFWLFWNEHFFVIWILEFYFFLSKQYFTPFFLLIFCVGLLFQLRWWIWI